MRSITRRVQSAVRCAVIIVVFVSPRPINGPFHCSDPHDRHQATPQWGIIARAKFSSKEMFDAGRTRPSLSVPRRCFPPWSTTWLSHPRAGQGRSIDWLCPFFFCAGTEKRIGGAKLLLSRATSQFQLGGCLALPGFKTAYRKGEAPAEPRDKPDPARREPRTPSLAPSLAPGPYPIFLASKTKRPGHPCWARSERRMAPNS
jgi:hypothetical protein